MTEAILVTGASSGIGRAIALHLSRHTPVIVSGRNMSRLQKTATECHGKAFVLQLDLIDLPALELAVSSLLAEQELRVTGFVHAAGIVKVQPSRMDKIDCLAEVFATNFFSAVELCRILCSKKANDKRLSSTVCISSIYAKAAASGHAAYCASKAALDSYMRALACELAPARFNSILAGGVRTPMSEQALSDPATAARLTAGYPLGIGEPADIAAATDWLLSSEARWVTGTTLTVDGGRLCRA